VTKILIADDEQDVRDLLADILLGAGYEVIEAPDGGAALDKATSEQPDLILLDVLMPVMDGLQVLRRLRENPAMEEIPVILLTAFPVKEDESAGTTFRYTHYITKPWRRGVIELTIKNALREAGTVAELKQTQQQIIQQERLSALGQLASGIAHDFNNALTPILGFSELLLTRPERLEDRETARGHIEMINTAARDAAAVVAHLREFYRKRDDSDSFAPAHLDDIVGQGLSLTQSKWKDEAQMKGVTIRVKTDLQKVPPVSANESDLREALTNLLLNAVDAMPEGGTLTISTRVDSDQVVLAVRDTGTGMTEEVKQRCLDPFFTTKGVDGTGMGLAMVYGIIRRHEGSMDIVSEPGKGTTFTIRLPIQMRSSTGVNGASPSHGPDRALNVLVVDDEPMVRQLVTEYLTGDGHTVETATNGRKGLERFFKGKFDLVVTDRAMPEMSGDQMAEAIKAEAPGTPVILLTGFGDIMMAKDEKPSGAALIVAKPVTMGDLRKAVAMVTAKIAPQPRGVADERTG